MRAGSVMHAMMVREGARTHTWIEPSIEPVASSWCGAEVMIDAQSAAAAAALAAAAAAAAAAALACAITC